MDQSASSQGASVTPKPTTQEEEALYARACLGNASAATFLRVIGRLGQLLDDLADGDAADRSAAAAKAAFMFFGEVGTNDFYVVHSKALAPALVGTALAWDASNDWARSENRISRMFAFVERHHDEHVIFLVALLIGGWDHARGVMREAHCLYRRTDPESFEDWEAEMGASS